MPCTPNNIKNYDYSWKIFILEGDINPMDEEEEVDILSIRAGSKAPRSKCPCCPLFFSSLVICRRIVIVPYVISHQAVRHLASKLPQQCRKEGKTTILLRCSLLLPRPKYRCGANRTRCRRVHACRHLAARPRHAPATLWCTPHRPLANIALSCLYALHATPHVVPYAHIVSRRKPPGLVAPSPTPNALCY